MMIDSRRAFARKLAGALFGALAFVTMVLFLLGAPSLLTGPSPAGSGPAARHITPIAER